MPSFLSIPYRIEDSVLAYSPSGTSPTMVSVHRASEILGHCTQYSFPTGSPFLPEKFLVAERLDSRGQNDLNRLCVLDQDRQQYKIFTIPSKGLGLVGLDEDISMT
jgi:hypothetical protein